MFPYVSCVRYLGLCFVFLVCAVEIQNKALHTAHTFCTLCFLDTYGNMFPHTRNTKQSPKYRTQKAYECVTILHVIFFCTHCILNFTSSACESFFFEYYEISAVRIMTQKKYKTKPKIPQSPKYRTHVHIHNRHSDFPRIQTHETFFFFETQP